ncbi:hypothetical protein GCM10017779_24930 [Streptomyces capillispiralis]|nr:hypothetical protein GCM10017779_24930 [Streptomyces capillispiralis]
MSHVESSHLMELALGHAQGDEDADALRHIVWCPRCRRELAQMTRVVAAARGARVADLPAAPPERVWRRVARDVLREADIPHPGRHPSHRSPARGTSVVRGVRPAGAGARGGLLALALAAGALLVRRLRGRAGRGPDRRRRPAWWRRAC